MTNSYKSVLDACGKVSRAVFVKAAKRLDLSPESYRIAEEVLVLGFRQSVAARHAGVSRQRAHSVCRELVDAINLNEERKKK